ncbi:MAG: hypothetical protein LBQ66_01335 [Planctomycetaceae bacterium]|jgi:hypothetical protein|nr:hypothetical protein [Planctomycetaceae bacterium]
MSAYDRDRLKFGFRGWRQPNNAATTTRSKPISLSTTYREQTDETIQSNCVKVADKFTFYDDVMLFCNVMTSFMVVEILVVAAFLGVLMAFWFPSVYDGGVVLLFFALLICIEWLLQKRYGKN